jgi:hypothetical protein
MDAAFGAAGAFFQGQQDKEKLAYDRKRQEELDRQAAAYQAAQQAERDRAESFTESLYAPGRFEAKTTIGKYQQDQPGHKKGTPKIMTGPQQYVPGTGGYYIQTQQADIADKAAQAQQRISSANLNQARIPKELALAYYWKTKPGIDEQRIYMQAKAHADALKARLASGRSSGLSQSQLLNLERQVAQANDAATQRYEAMVMHAQDHADSMNVQATNQGLPANYQPVNIPAPQPITINMGPQGPVIGGPGVNPVVKPPAPQKAKHEGERFPNAPVGDSAVVDGVTYHVWSDHTIHTKPEPAPTDSRNSFMPFNIPGAPR